MQHSLVILIKNEEASKDEIHILYVKHSKTSTTYLLNCNRTHKLVIVW